MSIFKFDIIPHCDMLECSLGFAEYICPFCKKENTDYSKLFYGYEDLKPIDLECSQCKTKFKIVYENGDWYVKR